MSQFDLHLLVVIYLLSGALLVFGVVEFLRKQWRQDQLAGLDKLVQRENDLLVERNRCADRLEAVRQQLSVADKVIAERDGRIRCLEDEVEMLNRRITDLIGGPG